MAQVMFDKSKFGDVILKDKRFFIIDDFKEFRDSVKRDIAALGVKSVDTSEDANDAIYRISRQPYDIILCDYNLGAGKKNGQQIFEELTYKKVLGYSNMFFMVTAENTIKMVMSVMDYQPDGYLVKPFTIKDIVQRIKTVNEKKQLFAEIDKAIMRRDYIGAITSCDSLLKNNSKYLLEILKVKGEIYMTTGDYKNAGNLYSLVLNKHRLVWAVFNMGKVYYHTKKYLDAENTFRALIAENDMFVPAYDWLAKTLEATGDKKAAQIVLEDAVAKSPQAIFRQRALGNIAYSNKDFDMAEKSFNNAVEIGKTSLFKDPSDYVQLAKVYVKKDDTGKALDMIDEARADFIASDEIMLKTTLLESSIYADTGQHDKALQYLNKAEKISNDYDGKVPPELAIELSGAFIKAGEKEKGMEMMKLIVQNNHSDTDILRKVQETFDVLGMSEEGVAFVANTKAEIIRVNNRGVELISKGMLTEAIDLFEKAADGMPSNFIINLNALRAIVGYLLKKGKDNDYIDRCEKYIDRINVIEPDNIKFQQLVGRYRNIR
ncbi:tetratricopeptide repeat-containing response regulator [Candidatus Magnetomonas plexicatena]|uniref:tetratricopeptide repeat-containing response regulator n=1 Tax=Candidatus Magnetomonas plexicatena TaxID=2552947 RepID=UPI001C7897E0|nr:response regulator [Nitrospirales bacterium LBB_01]